MESHEHIVVALDNLEEHEIGPAVKELAPHVGMFKVGLELIIKVGAPKVVKMVKDEGGKVFLDGKFHDIPETMAMAAKAASALGLEFFNFHASAGPKGVQAAVEASENTRVLGVTVLTSHGENECRSVFGDVPDAKVLQFSGWLDAFGADGVICSPKEAELIRAHYKELVLVCPGIRPLWARKNDQARVTTPSQAILNGVDYMVIGRPIMKPPPEFASRAEAAKRIAEEIAVAEGGR